MTAFWLERLLRKLNAKVSGLFRNENALKPLF